MQSSKLSKFLKKKREDAGLTQKQISEKLGYGSPQFVSNWERGLCSPPLESLGKIVSLLKINNAELINIYLASVETDLRSVLNKKNRIG